MQKTIIIPLIIVLLLLGFQSCSTANSNANKTTTSVNDTRIMKGKIIAKTFVNKGGKEISSIKDLYFETHDETYFIKFMDSNISYEEALELLDQPIAIEGELRDGLWDISDEDPAYAQSRVGVYLIIHQVK